MGRCYECCQENCGYRKNCSCYCHVEERAAAKERAKKPATEKVIKAMKTTNVPTEQVNISDINYLKWLAERLTKAVNNPIVSIMNKEVRSVARDLYYEAFGYAPSDDRNE